jgi:deoxycytidylate deaminase
MNAISQAASYGINIDKAHIYITHSPCLECFKMILSSGITRIIFNELYRLTEKDIKIYNDIAGYRTLEIGNDKNDIEKYYYWHVSLDTKVWFKQ